MNREYIQMAFSVAILVLLAAYNTYPVDTGPETANVVDALEESESQEETPEHRAQITEEEATVINADAVVEIEQKTPSLDSLDEEELEKESGGVQSGIDLLDSPPY